MSDDLESLLGGADKAPVRKTGRTLRTGSSSKKKQAISADAMKGKTLVTDELPAAAMFLRPVTISFLAGVQGKQAVQIVKRMSKCPIVGYQDVKGKKQPLYDFMTAMSYLVPPKGNIEDWFASKNAASLPPYVNKMFWDSAAQRNRVMKDSCELWDTEQVLHMCGRIAMICKQESELWVENLPGRDEMTSKQYQKLTDQVIEFQDTLRATIIETCETFETEPMSGFIVRELDEAGHLPDAETG